MKGIILPIFILGLGFTSIAQNNFLVNTSTYIGGSSTLDEMNGVDVAPDGTIVMVGKLPSHNPQSISPIELLGGGDGILIRTNYSGTSVLSITRIGTVLYDVEVSDSGTIAISGSFGVGVLNADASAFIWFDSTILKGNENAPTNLFYGWFNQASVKPRYKRATNRVAIGSDGTVATLQQNKNYGSPYLYIYNKEGIRIYDTIFPYITNKVFPDRTFTDYFINVYPNDICVDGTNQSVIYAGWNPRKDNSVHMTDHPIHMPFIKCFGYDGSTKWYAYDWRAKDVYDKNRYADSRINDIVVGRDGYLYASGYIHGGDHMFLFNSTDLNQNSTGLVQYDNYSMASNMGAGIDHAFFFKYDPLTGQMLKGQGALVRKKQDGTDKPNQSQIKGIMADENGKVFLCGYAQPYIKNRSIQQINGITVGPKDTCEAFFMIVSPNWNSRETWTVFTQNKVESSAWGCSYRNGVGAIIGEVYAGDMITTANAIQPAKSVLYDGFLVTWGNLTTPMHTTIAENKFIIYPQPAQNHFYINSPKQVKAKIIDTKGITNLTIFLQKGINSINCNQLAKGQYLILFEENNSLIQTQSLIIQ